MHGLLLERADKLVGSLEGSAGEDEFAAIGDAIEPTRRCAGQQESCQAGRAEAPFLCKETLGAAPFLVREKSGPDRRVSAVDTWPSPCSRMRFRRHVEKGSSPRMTRCPNPEPA